MAPPRFDGREFGWYTRYLDVDGFHVQRLLNDEYLIGTDSAEKHFLTYIKENVDLNTEHSKEIQRLERIKQGITKKQEMLQKQVEPEQLSRINDFLNNNPNYKGEVSNGKIRFFLRSHDNYVKKLLKMMNGKSLTAQEVMSFARKRDGRNPVSVGQSFYRLKRQGKIQQKKGSGENRTSY